LQYLERVTTSPQSGDVALPLPSAQQSRDSADQDLPQSFVQEPGLDGVRFVCLQEVVSRKSRGSIEALQVQGKGTYVLFPFDVEAEFGVKGRVPIRASINGIPYADSLSKCGGQRYVLGILKSIRDQMEANIADEIELWRDYDQDNRRSSRILASLTR
jgi:hypothetical protein